MLKLIIQSLVTGIVIGGLGRLVLPGKQDIGWGLTIVAGVVAALVGGGIAYLIGFHESIGLVLLIEVALAAVVVGLIAKSKAGKTQA
jgi:uncharacterized membrane protein YeaQ/YmgE (transglycosylase-associated protein family)